MTKIGFTGSRRGMTKAQKVVVNEILGGYTPFEFEFHHGDCVGADEDSHEVAYKNYAKKIVVHPPSNSELRAYCGILKWVDPEVVEIREEKEYLDRNKDIVNETDFLVACPNGSDGSYGRAGKGRQGGTWYTIRCARSVNKPVTIVYQNGNIDELI